MLHSRIMVFLFLQSYGVSILTKLLSNYLLLVCGCIWITERLWFPTSLMLWIHLSRCFDFELSKSSLKWSHTEFSLWNHDFSDHTNLLENYFHICGYIWITEKEWFTIILAWCIHLSRCFDFWLSESWNLTIFLTVESWFCCCYKVLWKSFSCMWMYMNTERKWSPTILMWWIHLSRCCNFWLCGSSLKWSLTVFFIMEPWFCWLFKVSWKILSCMWMYMNWKIVVFYNFDVLNPKIKIILAFDWV